jgi:hypothetical protein
MPAEMRCGRTAVGARQCVSASAASRKQKSRKLHSSWAWKPMLLLRLYGSTCQTCFSFYAQMDSTRLYHAMFSPTEYEKSHLRHWPLLKLLEQWNADLTRNPMSQYPMYSLTGSITLFHVLVVGLCSGCWLWQTQRLELETGTQCAKHCTKCSTSSSWNDDYVSRWCVLTCVPLLNFRCLSCQYYDGSNLCQCWHSVGMISMASICGYLYLHFVEGSMMARSLYIALSAMCELTMLYWFASTWCANVRFSRHLVNGSRPC